ncbi:MAG: NADH-quinone oxidoreductase subunit C [Capsulimonadaceae bacterium]
MNALDWIQESESRWPGTVKGRFDAPRSTCELTCAREDLVELCRYLHQERRLVFAGLIVEEGATEWQLRYIFNSGLTEVWVCVIVEAPLTEKTVPSISGIVHAVDWHEREAEDLFGLVFEDHPRLGDFVLHNDVWPESVEPMRRHFNSQRVTSLGEPDQDWRPRQVVDEPGAFMMPIGPKFSGVTESVHFLLESVGEDVIHLIPRLFYKWRAVEKTAQGLTVDHALLLAERFAATSSFAHGLGYCQAVEAVSGVEVPRRAQVLRVFLAELERLRHHAGAIEHICESTALAIAASQAAICEEDLLRVSGELAGHRYLTGLLAPGGLSTDLSDNACRLALDRSRQVLRNMNDLEKALRLSSSFLDRLEEVGAISHAEAEDYGLVGPVARASGHVHDLRTAQPYASYASFHFDIPSEEEGDGYARLRVLFAESRQSVRIMEQAAAALTGGGVLTRFEPEAGAALGWTEAPRGAALHWVRIDGDGKIVRYRISPPSFANWHGFHIAVENFAFQDFPIILSTFDLSVAENDR